MENKKLDLGKITITRLTNLHHIRGGSPFTIDNTNMILIPTTKTDDGIIDPEEDGIP